jgi:hypothetical protein
MMPATPPVGGSTAPTGTGPAGTPAPARPTLDEVDPAHGAAGTAGRGTVRGRWTPRTVRVRGRDVTVIRFEREPPDVATVREALSAAGLDPGRRPVVVLAGGAAGLRTTGAARWRALFRDGLVAGLVRAGACLVDGGTDAGVMTLAAAGRAAAGADYPVVGVVAEGTVRWPDRPPPPLADAAELAPEHTHIVSVPGRSWGVDPPWISLVASALAGSAGSLTVVVNGGPVTRADVARSLEAGRRTLVVAGTGRLADAIAEARRAPADAEPGEAEAAASDLLDVVEGLRRPAELADAIAALGA